jgi:hypothetical protein
VPEADLGLAVAQCALQRILMWLHIRQTGK